MGTRNAKSNYLEQKVIEAVLKNTSFAGGTNTYVALLTAITTGETPTVTEVAGGSYARQAMLAASAWSAGGQVNGRYEVNNAADIAFPVAAADWGEIVGWRLMDASSGGNELYYGYLSVLEYEFTALASSDTFTAYGHTLVNGDRVVVQGLTLPTGVSEDVIYFVVGVSGSTFQLATTSGGSAINITADGSGVVHLVKPKRVDNGDQFKFLTGNLKIAEA